MGNWHIGVIGGAGLHEAGAPGAMQEIEVTSAFGAPSGPVHTGWLGEVRFSFIARQGAGHTIPPSAVNDRANIDALKRCGVTDLIAFCAIGSLRETLAAGDLVLIDQVIDCTHARARSFFDQAIVAHVPFADPVCPRLAGLAAAAARAAARAGGRKAAAGVHEGATCVAIEGPQDATRAECRLYRSWGADGIAVAASPEARLAREAELPFALVGMVGAEASWREGGAGDGPGRDAGWLAAETSAAGLASARAMLGALAAALPAAREPSPIDTVLDRAILTPRQGWDLAGAARLDAVAGRVLKIFPRGAAS